MEKSWKKSILIMFYYNTESVTVWKVSKYADFSRPYFSGVSLLIQSEYGKIRTRKNSVFGYFSRSGNLNFDMHISKLCNKSAGQLNALNRINRYLGFAEKKVLINSFIYGNFNYWPLVWHSVLKLHWIKQKIFQKCFKISFKWLWTWLQIFIEKA